MKKIILCDLDDTLIQTQETYNEITNETINIIMKKISNSSDRSEVLNEFNKLDVQNMKKYHMTVRYPKTFVEIYEIYAEKHGIRVKEEDKEEIYQKANEIFEIVIPLYEGAISLLEEMSGDDISLEVLTMGDPKIQKKRLKDVNIENYFSKCHIIESDKREVMRNAIESVGAENVVMIGNSLNSDIKPSLELGINAIHIERQTWAYDNAEINNKDNKYHLVKDYVGIKEKLTSLEIVKEYV